MIETLISKKPFSLYLFKILFLSKLNKSGLKLEPPEKKLIKLKELRRN